MVMSKSIKVDEVRVIRVGASIMLKPGKSIVELVWILEKMVCSYLY